MDKFESFLIKLSFYLVIISALLTLSACQEEIEPEIEINSENSILPESELSDYILKVVLLDGSEDNIIDLSSCTTVVFPISGIYDEDDTVELDDDYVVVTFNSIEEVLAFGGEALDIEWTYPFSVILSNHTEVILASSDDLGDIQDQCIEGGDDDDIECIDFNYPVKLSIFDSKTELVTTESIMSDKEMYRFFNNPNDIISIEYPISLIDSKGAVTVIEDNQQLLENIRTAEGTCDEQDIVDFEEDLLTELGQLLVNAEWKIDLFEDGTDRTVLYEGFTLDFRGDLTMTATGADNAFEGEWGLDSFDAITFLELYFEGDDAAFTLLNEAEWKVISFDLNTINLEIESDGESSRKRLRLKR